MNKTKCAILSPSLNPSRRGREVKRRPLDGGGWMGVKKDGADHKLLLEYRSET